MMTRKRCHAVALNIMKRLIKPGQVHLISFALAILHATASRQVTSPTRPRLPQLASTAAERRRPGPGPATFGSAICIYVMRAIPMIIEL